MGRDGWIALDTTLVSNDYYGSYGNWRELMRGGHVQEALGSAALVQGLRPGATLVAARRARAFARWELLRHT